MVAITIEDIWDMTDTIEEDTVEEDMEDPIMEEVDTGILTTTMEVMITTEVDTTETGMVAEAGRCFLFNYNYF